MNEQAVFSLFYCLMLFLIFGLLLVWLMRWPKAAKPDVEDDVYMEPGTIGKSTYWQAVTLIAQVDNLIERMDEAERDKLLHTLKEEIRR